MNGSVLYEETQGFPPWVYVLLGAVLALILALLLGMRLTTRVDRGAVSMRLGFLYSTRVPLSEILRAEAVAYRPLRDYGGWGVRGFGRRRAINVRGNRGVLLIRTDGSSLLVGSQRPRDLLNALARAGVTTEDRLPVEIREF